MIEITPTLSIAERELVFDYIRAAGPGGQNVNKVSTAVQLRFDVRRSNNLPEDVKDRLLHLAGSRATQDGVIVIEAKSYRTQDENRTDAQRRLFTLIEAAAVPPAVRVAGHRPPMTASAAKDFDKKRRTAPKRLRHYDPDEWE